VERGGVAFGFEERGEEFLPFGAGGGGEVQADGLGAVEPEDDFGAGGAGCFAVDAG
jgi:hypothetical protein